MAVEEAARRVRGGWGAGHDLTEIRRIAATARRSFEWAASIAGSGEQAREFAKAAAVMERYVAQKEEEESAAMTVEIARAKSHDLM